MQGPGAYNFSTPHNVSRPALLPPATGTYYFGYGNVQFWCNISSIFLLCVILVTCFPFQLAREYRPRHDIEALSDAGGLGLAEQSPTVAAPGAAVAASAGPGDVPDLLPDVPAAVPPARAETPGPPEDLLHAAPAPPDPVPVLAVPAPLPAGDPLRWFNLPPLNFPDYGSWVNIVERLRCLRIRWTLAICVSGIALALSWGLMVFGVGLFIALPLTWLLGAHTLWGLFPLRICHGS